jgi:hypothetical protein
VTRDRFLFSLSAPVLLLLLMGTRRWLTSGEGVASASTLGDSARLLPDSGIVSGDFVTDSDCGEDMGDSVGGNSGSSLETCFKEEE